ncbi:13395_t:CDS:2 [Dentiscutata erythropus]|uniref:13395_t:CDS:1 n=1 Tax=Dentiscutata erythropus TaxID=1348616 RepID=A0A9N8VHM6_9GLOM|nr:13395_t:CDS:2 [Dentiscutata erythropus]
MPFKTFMESKNIRSNKEQFLTSNDDNSSDNETDNSMDTFIVDDDLSEESNIIRKFDDLYMKNENSNDTSDGEESSDFYEVERIEKHRENKLVITLQIRWSAKYNSWVDASDMHATELIKKYWDCKDSKSNSPRTKRQLKKRTRSIAVSSTKKKFNSSRIRKNMDASSEDNNFKIKSGSRIQKFLGKKEKNLMASFYLESSSSDDEIQYAPEFKPNSQTQEENTRVISFYENPDLVHLEDRFYSLDWEQDVDRVGWIEKTEENSLVFLFW